MVLPEYRQSVFINCPFDAEYTPMFEAIVLAVQDLGFRPRSARERIDSGEVRLSKIRELIAASRYSIHDLSRTELDSATALPRSSALWSTAVTNSSAAISRPSAPVSSSTSMI